MPNKPVLLVHGGAWAIPDELVDAHLNGVRNASALAEPAETPSKTAMPAAMMQQRSDVEATGL